MFLLSPMFEPIMGMEPSTIYSMLPINDRKVGVILDASVTNPDMARDFGEYPIEDLQVPTLIFHINWRTEPIWTVLNAVLPITVRIHGPTRTGWSGNC